MSYFWHTSVLYHWSEKMPSNWYFRLNSVFAVALQSLRAQSHRVPRIFLEKHWKVILLLTRGLGCRGLPSPSVPLNMQRAFQESTIQFLWCAARCCAKIRPMRGNSRQSWSLDSTPWIPDSSYWIPDSLSVELGFYKIAIINGIPNSLSCILASKAQYIVYSKKKKSRILNCTNKIKISLMPESGFPYKGRKDSRTWDPAWCWSYILILYISCF